MKQLLRLFGLQKPTVYVLHFNRMTDEQLRKALMVDAECDQIRAFREILARCEDEARAAYANIEATPEQRSNAGIMLCAFDVVRRELEIGLAEAKKAKR